jgi:ribonuclease HI
MTVKDRIACYTDGASRGNPGPSAYAVILVRENAVICEETGYLGEGTNNTAEYEAMIHGLQRAATCTAGEVCCYSDSELVIRQLTGRYAIRKAHLRDLAAEVRALCTRFERVVFNAVPREHPCIIRADELCNDTLDTHDS